MTHAFTVGSGLALTVAVAVAAASDQLPTWALVVGLFVPLIAVIVGYLLTRRKIQEVHVLVNSRLSSTLDALSQALIENVRLKDRLGEPVSTEERAAPTTIRENRGGNT